MGLSKKVEQLAQLGGVCVSCGSNENLERDCITPRGDEHHKMSTDQRATFYAREIKAGNVQLLCKDCHTKKTVVDIRSVGEIQRQDETRNRSEGTTSAEGPCHPGTVCGYAPSNQQRPTP